MKRTVLSCVGLLFCAALPAKPVTYVLDPLHTYPSFEADHMGGLSIWRGKFTETAGKVVYDKEAAAGSIDVTVQTASIQFGTPKLDEHAKSEEIFDVAKYPTATFVGKFTKFSGATPTQAEGMFTLHGVTKPLTLTINQFLCKMNPMTKSEVCGADASATFNRSDFGINFGEKFGFKQAVKLSIQVEAKPE